MKDLIRTIFRSLFNKYSGLSVAIHWILVLLSLLLRPDWQRPIHFFYETFLFQLLLLIDLPAIVVAEQIGFPINLSVSENSVSSILAVIVMISMQWFLILFVINQILFSFKRVKTYD